MKHLVLFDIDGTLLRCGRHVRTLFAGVLKEVFGHYEAPRCYTFAGKTDPQIVLDLVRQTGLDEADIFPKLPEVRQAYVTLLEEGLRPEHVRMMPGVRSLLERLSARHDVLLGLLTGNWRRGAEVKLSRLDLNRFFSFGAFGDDAVDRRDLVPVAFERATAVSGRRFAPGDALIVGDSIRDVDCAQAAGVRSLAVATGHTPIEELRAAGPDWAFADLEEAARELRLFSV
ncbi:MAG: HAD family hydrolase [bacterium]|nr:HAD family hydrolase [bacterium]